MASALVVAVALVAAAMATASSVEASVFRGILSAGPPAAPPFVFSPNSMSVGASGAKIVFTVSVTNLTHVAQTETLSFNVNHVITYYGLWVGDGQPGQPGITFKPGDAPNTTQQGVGTPQIFTMTFPPPSAGPTTLSFQQTVTGCGYFQVDIGQHKTATLPQANLAFGFTRVLGCNVKSLPTLTTNAGPPSGLTGSRLNDTAHLGGGSNPTGTIVFTLFDSSGASAYTQTLGVTHGDGDYTTSPGFVAGVAGTWHWQAAYSGDANNMAVTSAAGDEPVIVSAPTGAVLAATGSFAPGEIVSALLLAFGVIAIVTGVAWRRRPLR